MEKAKCFKMKPQRVLRGMSKDIMCIQFIKRYIYNILRTAEGKILKLSGHVEGDIGKLSKGNQPPSHASFSCFRQLKVTMAT